MVSNANPTGMWVTTLASVESEKSAELSVWILLGMNSASCWHLVVCVAVGFRVEGFLWQRCWLKLPWMFHVAMHRYTLPLMRGMCRISGSGA